MSRIDALPARLLRSGVTRAQARAALWNRAALALTIGFALLALLARAQLPNRALAVDIGDEGPFRVYGETATVRNLFGLHDPEWAEGESFRWTREWARMVVPSGHRLGTPLLLRLRLCGCHPGGKQPSIHLSIDNRPLGELPATDSYRRYAILVQPHYGDAGSDLYLELRMPTASFDGRLIGARLDRIDLVAAPTAALPWPEPLAPALLGALATLAILWLVPDRAARLALLAALLSGPVFIIRIYHHQELASVTLALLAVLGIALAALARPRQLAPALLLAIAAIGMPLLPQLLGGWLVDDAFISFRYALHLVEGHGLVFNPGERVEGYTNFLWTMIIAAVLWLGADPTYIARALTIPIAQATVALCYVIGQLLLPAATAPSQPWIRRIGLESLTAPLLLASSGPFLLYSARSSGLETALFTLLVLAGISAYIHAIQQAGEERAWRYALAGALLALAALTRPEGVLVLALTAGHALLGKNRMRYAAPLLAAFLAIFLPYYVWRFAYYGLPLPNTFYVKVGATPAQVLRGMRYLGSYWAAEGWAWAAGAIVIAVAWMAVGSRQSAVGSRQSAVGGITHRPFILHPSSFIALIVLAYMGYIAVVGGDWLPEARFVVPLIPLLALLAQAGLARLARRGRLGAALAAILLAWALVDHGRHTLGTSAYDSTNMVWRENLVVARRREVGRWLRDHTPPDALVAVEAAGALPYYSRRPALDILGLNDRHIASLDVPTIGQGKPGHEKVDIPYVLARRPAIIPYFSAPYFEDQPLFQQHYVREEYDGPEGYTVIVFRRKDP